MANVDVTRIASNIGALNALNSLQQINSKLAIHQTRLSTGKKINSAADDPAGLTIATKMLSRSEGMKVALDNISDASNMLSVAEAGLSKMNDILVIMRNKAEQAASDTLGTTERDAIATQLSAFANQIDSMVAETKWNNTQLLDGTVNKRFQTGVDNGEFTQWQLSTKFDPTTLGISTNVANDAASNLAAPANTVSTIGNATQFTGLSKLSTGSYTAEILGSAASATVGQVTTTSTFSGSAAVSLIASNGAGAGEIANGSNAIAVTGYVAGTHTLSYTVNGGPVQTLVVGALNTANDLGSTGLRLNIGGTDDLATKDAALTAVAAGSNKTYNLDYIKKNNIQFNLKSGSGDLVSIDANGTNDVTNPTATVGYTTFGGTYDTGRGITMTFDAAPVVGKASFDWAVANKYSVDVSSATKASAYMSTVNTAMDTVNTSLASLGSLMARLNFKSEQVAGAQVNIEGAYSRIMNANMAEEQMNASKYSILQQTAVAMLAQANQAPQSLLSLFR